MKVEEDIVLVGEAIADVIDADRHPTPLRFESYPKIYGLEHDWIHFNFDKFSYQDFEFVSLEAGSHVGATGIEEYLKYFATAACMISSI